MEDAFWHGDRIFWPQALYGRIFRRQLHPSQLIVYQGTVGVWTPSSDLVELITHIIQHSARGYQAPMATSYIEQAQVQGNAGDSSSDDEGLPSLVLSSGDSTVAPPSGDDAFIGDSSSECSVSSAGPSTSAGSNID